MSKRQEIYGVVLDVIKKYNTLGLGPEIGEGDEGELFGPNSNLDSLGLISVILLVEEQITLKLGESIILADERAMSMKNSPFKNIESLTEYILATLEKR